MENPIARVNAFTAFSERPGYSDYFVDNAFIDNRRSEPFMASELMVDKILSMLNSQTEVELMLSLDKSQVEFIVVNSIFPAGRPILTDGTGRYYDIESRRPVNRAGQHITLAEAEHNARNHALQVEAMQRRKMKKAA